ncbi:MAG: FRG domain-containing protein [Bryobacteraceae bacterium]
MHRTPTETELVEWFALMQHWGLPTRLLDFTLSPYVALYFALRERPSACKTCGPTHAAVWAVHHVALQSIAKRALGLPNAKPEEFRQAFDKLLAAKSDSGAVVPIQPFLMNERLAAQQGIFLCPSSLRLPFDVLISQPDDFRFVVVPEERKVKEEFARKLIVPLSQRTQMLRELSRMNISAASLFPGLDGYARSIRESYEMLESEAPVYKEIALETLEDFGWTG